MNLNSLLQKIKGKDLSTKQRQEQKKLLIYPLFFVVFAVVIYFIFGLSFLKKGEEGGMKNGYNIEIPVNRNDNLLEDKLKAFQAEDVKSLQDQRVKNLEEMFIETGKTIEENSNVDLPTLNQPGKKTRPGIPESITTYRDLTKQVNSFYQPSPTPEKVELKNETGENHPPVDPYKMMEESYKLAAKYLNTYSPVVATPPVLLEQPGNVGGDRDVTPVESVSGGVVSRLGKTGTNTGFYSLSDKKNSGSLIKACVFSDCVLMFGESGGVQKLCLRLLEAMQVGDIIVPRNTLLTGLAKLGNGRLSVTVDNLIHDNKMISVSLHVYDVDGMEGINTPGSQEINSTKEAATTLTGNVGTSINLSGSAGQQLATDLARGVIQNATTYFNKKMKTTKVSLNGNYQIYLTSNK